MGEAYVERWELVSICHPGASSYSRELTNRFESLMLTRCENANIAHGQRSNNCNMLFIKSRLFYTTCLDVYDPSHYSGCHPSTARRSMDFGDALRSREG